MTEQNGIVASRKHRKDFDGVAPTLVVGRAGNRASGRCVLRDRVKPLAFDVIPVTTDVGTTVIGGGVRHVAICSACSRRIGTENAKRYFIELLSTTPRPLRAEKPKTQTLLNKDNR